MSKKVNLKKINQNNARKQQALQKLQPGSPKKTVVKKVPVRELTVPQLIKHADEGNIACMRELYEIYKKEYEATHSQAALDNYARYLQMAAEAGDALSQYNLSVAYQEGKRLKKDTEKCMYWMSRCAESSPVTGHFWLGKYYRQGSPVPADRQEAVRHLEAALAAKPSGKREEDLQAWAAFDLSGQYMMNGANEEARRLMHQSAEGGYEQAVAVLPLFDLLTEQPDSGLGRLSALLTDDDIPVSEMFRTAFDMYRAMAAAFKKANVSFWELWKAVKYVKTGRYTELYDLAYKVNRQMAAGADRKYGAYYYVPGSADVVSGINKVLQSLPAADPSIRNEIRAINDFMDGSVPIFNTAEALIMTEDEISRDPVHFISLLKKAADAGEGYGALMLGQAYMYGDHVQADQALAVKYLQTAADRDIPDALAYLAHQYYFGLGLPGDARRARKLLSEADVYFDAEICEEIEDGIMAACRGRIPKDALKPFWFLHEKKIRRDALRDTVGRQAAQEASDPVINEKLEKIMARLDQLTVVSLDTNMRTRSLEAGIAEIYRFMTTDLARQLQEEKMRLRSQAYDEEKEERFFERMDAWISSRVKSADSLAGEQTRLLEDLFGDVWDLLLPESCASLVSAHVLYESCREIHAEGFDFSGICISATSALEGEIRRRLYNDFMTWLQDAGIEETEIEYVRGKVTKSFGFTLGCVPYVFGVKGSSQAARERVQDQFFPYMKAILADHACPDVFALFCSSDADAFVTRTEFIREEYRNKAAHVENMTREEAQACMLAVTDLLMDFYHLLDPQAL